MSESPVSAIVIALPDAAGAADCAPAAATTREAVADRSGNQPTTTSNATAAPTSVIRGLRFIGHLFIEQNATTPPRHHETTKQTCSLSFAEFLSRRVFVFVSSCLR